MPARVKFRRPKQLADMWRAYTLVVNGQLVASLKRDAWLEIEVPEGRVELAAEIDWCGSNKLVLTLGPDEQAEVVVQNRYGALRAGKAITEGAADYLRLTLAEGSARGH